MPENERPKNPITTEGMLSKFKESPFPEIWDKDNLHQDFHGLRGMTTGRIPSGDQEPEEKASKAPEPEDFNERAVKFMDKLRSQVPPPPTVVEVLSASGQHQYWKLVDQETGETIWSGDKEPKPIKPLPSPIDTMLPMMQRIRYSDGPPLGYHEINFILCELITHYNQVIEYLDPKPKPTKDTSSQSRF